MLRRNHTLVAGMRFAVLLLSVGVCQTAFAQAQPKPPTKKTPVNNSAISVTESFEPTFRIEPLSHRLKGKPGDVIAFSFSIESANRDTTVEVQPIGLRQEMTGLILHDDTAPNADNVRLTTPSTLRLEANKATTIEGVARIPAGDAKFHSLGLLVKDIGAKSSVEPSFTSDGKRKTQAGIQFVTQYVLRLDLDVQGVRGEQASRLVIEQVKLAPVEGRPQLRAIVSNPTDTTFEFELRARLRSSPSDRSFKTLRLAMPVRATVEDDTRFIGRILPKSRIRMEELLPEAIAGGDYEADLEILYDNRIIGKKTMPIEAIASNFPAQEVLIAQFGEGLQVSPAQVELSQLRGGNRRLTMHFKNNGKELKTISLKALGSNDLELQSLIVQPAEFPIAPGATRKVPITLKGQLNAEQTADYGYLTIESKSDKKDFKESKKLPLAVLYKKQPQTRISVSPLVWDATGDYAKFKTTVENSGATHMPIDARLTISDETGRRISILGGFGKWLLPGEKLQVDFRVDQPLSAGEYQLKCELQTGAEPAVVQQKFTVNDLENALRKTASANP